MTMITPSYLGETIEYSSLHACRSTLEDPKTLDRLVKPLNDALDYTGIRTLFRKYVLLFFIREMAELRRTFWDWEPLGARQMLSLRSLAFILASAIRRARALSSAALHRSPDSISGRKRAKKRAMKMATKMAVVSMSVPFQ